MALSHKASSNSLRSLASTSSTQSGVSLQRSSRTERRRTRSRSRTVTSREALPSPSQPIPAIPTPLKEIGPVSPSETASVNDDQLSNADSDDDARSLIAYLNTEDTEVVKTPKLTSTDMLPAFSPPTRLATAIRLPEIDISKANARMSMTTQESYTSQFTSGTSYYPRSSTTGTVDSLPTPSSTSGPSTFEPEIHEPRELDTDDVSYRLRLLVNNNYFLPPAHAKPKPSDFAPPPQEIQKKASPFLDIFRIGKSKSKPTTPTSSHSPSFDLPAPVLRTTSDSTTVTAHGASRQQAPAPIAKPSPNNFPDRTPRVVVVREKMEDIAQAAKQAEEEFKIREAFESGSQRAQQPSVTDIIDPTDVVDLPLPSSEYPFAVQTSALHGLGVDQSVGAALLAERLPPPNTGLSPIERSADDAWRMALLHDAVSLSLHSSANTSISLTSPRPVVSPGPSTSTSRLNTSSPASIRSAGSTKLPPPIQTKPALEQRILNHPIIDSRPFSPQIPNAQPPAHTPRRRERAQTETLHSPLRAETPFTLHTPLTPAPRPRTQPSQTESPGRRSEDGASAPSDLFHFPSIRRSLSTPALNDIHANRMGFMMTPPPTQTPESFQSLRASSASVYSVEEEEEEPLPAAARPSVTLSMADEHSTEYSQRSPTASAFFDALSQGPASRSSLNYQSMRGSPIPNRSGLSPPPRSSTTSSFGAAFPIRHTPSPLAINSNVPGRSFLSLVSGHSSEILEPEPTTPPLPSPEDPRRLSSDPTSEVRLRTTSQRPASPPSFFDTLQSQLNALDDLDSSDESDNDLAPPRPLFGSDSPLMRLGNHSSPSVSRTVDMEYDPLPPRSPAQLQRRTSDSKKPVGFVPPSPTFFTQRKTSDSDQSSSNPPLSTFEYYQHTRQQQKRPQTSSGVSTGGSRRREEEGVSKSELQKRIKKQRSLRRLDGLVMRHLEAEKDTIRRIAHTMRSDSSRR